MAGATGTAIMASMSRLTGAPRAPQHRHQV